MWLSLANADVAKVYRQNCFLSDKSSEQIALLLEQLLKKLYAEKLSAVTSLGHLYLTTALSWEDNLKNDSVSIGQRIDGGKPLITMSYHSNGNRKSNAVRQCSVEEAVEYIDLYVMRLLLEKYGSLVDYI